MKKRWIAKQRDLDQDQSLVLVLVLVLDHRPDRVIEDPGQGPDLVLGRGLQGEGTEMTGGIERTAIEASDTEEIGVLLVTGAGEMIGSTEVAEALLLGIEAVGLLLLEIGAAEVTLPEIGVAEVTLQEIGVAGALLKRKKKIKAMEKPQMIMMLCKPD